MLQAVFKLRCVNELCCLVYCVNSLHELYYCILMYEAACLYTLYIKSERDAKAAFKMYVCVHTNVHASLLYPAMFYLS